MMVFVVGQANQAPMELMDQREMMVTEDILALVALKDNVFSLMDNPALKEKRENQDRRYHTSILDVTRSAVDVLGYNWIQRSPWPYRLQG